MITLEEFMKEDKDIDWKEIALALAQRVNFAMVNLRTDGSGIMGDLSKPSEEWKHWLHYMADGMDMIPGMNVDREMLNTIALPPSKRKKEQREIMDRRAATLTPNAKSEGAEPLLAKLPLD